MAVTGVHPQSCPTATRSVIVIPRADVSSAAPSQLPETCIKPWALSVRMRCDEASECAIGRLDRDQSIRYDAIGIIAAVQFILHHRLNSVRVVTYAARADSVSCGLPFHSVIMNGTPYRALQKTGRLKPGPAPSVPMLKMSPYTS
jgi:hypothetical protein